MNRNKHFPMDIDQLFHISGIQSFECHLIDQCTTCRASGHQIRFRIHGADYGYRWCGPGSLGKILAFIKHLPRDPELRRYFWPVGALIFSSCDRVAPWQP